jgi:hypothetical protein
MGYLHIDNLYKNQVILMFKECYALEKIHGTSAHLTWKHKENVIKFSSGGENHNNFVSTFDVPALTNKLSEIFPTTDVVIYGEAYGGKQQSMSNTYGKELKFVGFDVKVGHVWVNVPNAEDICNKVGIEFVDYVKITTDLESINGERDKDSVQAIRNGMGTGKLREGVVLRPLIEMTLNNGDRIISKHKRDEFKETKTPREVSPELFKVLSDAKEVAEEWVTEMRLTHILDKLPINLTMNDTKLVITSMIEDVYREAKGEIVESKEVTRAIGNKTVELFKTRLK